MVTITIDFPRCVDCNKPLPSRRTNRCKFHAKEHALARQRETCKKNYKYQIKPCKFPGCTEPKWSKYGDSCQKHRTAPLKVSRKRTDETQLEKPISVDDNRRECCGLSFWKTHVFDGLHSVPYWVDNNPESRTYLMYFSSCPKCGAHS